MLTTLWRSPYGTWNKTWTAAEGVGKEPSDEVGPHVTCGKRPSMVLLFSWQQKHPCDMKGLFVHHQSWVPSTFHLEGGQMSVCLRFLMST